MASDVLGVAGFGGLGVGDQCAGVGVEHRARVVHRDPLGLVDGIDGRGDSFVAAQGQRELDLFIKAGGDDFLRAECRVAAQHDRPAYPAPAGGGGGLRDLPGGAASGAGLAAAQPGLGDHRRRLRHRQRGDQRGQALAQQRPSGDLGVPERSPLFVVSVDRAQQRVDVQNARCSAMPGSSGVRCASAARCSRATAASWLACPKVNSRRNTPSVEGAYTSSNTRGVPPARNTFTSSILSAPHIMPAMIVVSFPAALTAPETTRVLGRSTARRSTDEYGWAQPVPMTETSNQLPTSRSLCPDRPTRPRRYAMIAPEMPSEPGTMTTSAIDIVPVQEAFSLFTRRSPKTDPPRIQAKNIGAYPPSMLARTAPIHGLIAVARVAGADRTTTEMPVMRWSPTVDDSGGL